MAVPISNVTRRVVYAASGTGPYAFTFEILSNTDIAVYQDDTLLTLTTNYTVTIASNGTGSITLVAAPTGATQIAIVGNRTIQRTTDFVTGGDFFANTVNDEMDQQTIFAQQNAEGLQRALSAPQTDPTTINMTLPRSSVRANKVLGFDGSGNPITTETLGTNRGNWASATIYYIRDIVKDTTNNNIWQCVTQHTSIGSQPIDSNADVAKWSLLVDAATATTSATNAAASASSAAASQATASSAATSATASASTATSAQVATEAARDATLAAFDNFDDRYLGSKSSDPTLDNDGNALVAGSLYFNTVSSAMKVYTGSFWSAAYVSGSGYLASANNLSDISSASTARTNLGLAIGTNVQAYDADLDGWALRKAPTTDGTSGQILTSAGAGVAPTWAAPAVTNAITATASGAIAAGDEVVVNSAGTVSKVAGAVGVIGSTYTYAGSASDTIAVYDSVNSRIIVAYTNGSNCFVNIGTVSGTVITWGTPASFGTNVNGGFSFAYDATNARFIASWQASSGIIYAVAGTISGSTITFGSSTAVKTYGQNGTSVAYDPVAARFVLVTNDFTAPNYPIAIVLSLSGTTITVNSFVNITTSYNTFNGASVWIVYDPTSGKMVWAAREGNSGNVISAVGTVSSTSTSWGTAVALGTNSTNFYLGYESISQKTMLVWTNNSTSVPYSTVYSISGTSLTMNTATQISPTTISGSLRFCSNTVANKIYFISRSSSTTYCFYLTGTISGTTATFGNETIYASVNQSIYSTVFNTNAGVIVNFFISAGTGYSSAQIIAYTNLTSTNFIGFSGAAYSNGATATIQTIGSVNTNQSGLTAGLQYYVLGSGVLSTTAGSPSVYAGTAVSATSIIVKG